MLGCGPARVTSVSDTDDASHEDTLGEPPYYRINANLDALGERVTIHKTPERIWVEKESGKITTWDEVVALNRTLHRDRFGALQKEFHAELTRCDANESFPIGIGFSAPTVLASEGADSETVAKAVAYDTAAMLEVLYALGIPGPRAARYIPSISVEAPAAAIQALSHHPLVTGIFDLRPVDGELIGPLSHHQSTHAVEHHGIDTAYDQPSQNGSYATGQRVGIIESGGLYDDASQKACGINHNHIAFSHATPDPQTGERVTYAIPPERCRTSGPSGCPSSSCTTCINMGYSSPFVGHCVNSTTNHPIGVASLISNTYNGGIPYAAAEARLYIANLAEPCPSGGSTASIFDWLVSQSVRTVSAQYTPCGVDGPWQDLYMRNHDLFVGRGAGNTAISPNPSDRRACPLSANSMCVGATNRHGEMACTSNWENPQDGLVSPSDREEPDIVAVGGQPSVDCIPTQKSEVESVRLARGDTGINTDWRWDAGTSFAGPTVVALAALMREACGDARGWSARALRAIMRTTAYEENPHGPPYSTPVAPVGGVTPLEYDWRDGGGWLSPQTAAAACDLDPVDGEDGEGIFDLLTGDGTTVNARIEYDPTKPQQLVRGDDEHWRDWALPIGGRVFDTVYYLESVPAGSRIRATISWNGCTDNPQSPWVALPARDIDLFLVRVDFVGSGPKDYVGAWLAGSQSVNDVNEGFDVEVNSTSDYAIVAGWVPGLGCGGMDREAYGWSVRRILP
jgi:hypothetical protein